METHPTYFETVTAMAFLLFSEANLNLAVIEVGLGGRRARHQCGLSGAERDYACRLRSRVVSG